VPSDERYFREPGHAERQTRIRFRDWRFRVRDILTAVEAIAAYTEGMTYEDFVVDPKTMDAVLRNLVTIGESTRWIPGPVLEAHPAVPWHTMRGVRNVVAHQYFGVDRRILWTTVEKDLPPLAPALEAVLQS